MCRQQKGDAEENGFEKQSETLGFLDSDDFEKKYNFGEGVSAIYHNLSQFLEGRGSGQFMTVYDIGGGALKATIPNKFKYLFFYFCVFLSVQCQNWAQRCGKTAEKRY